MAFFSQIFLLQKLHRTLWLNRIKSRYKRDWGKWIFFGSLTLMFVWGDYWFFHRILIYLDNLPLAVGEILITQLLSLLFLTFFSMLIFSNVIASIPTLYLSNDLIFLISSPLSSTAVFASRFWQTSFNSSWMVVVFGLPIFVAYGELFEAGWAYYCLLPFILFPFLVIPAGLGIPVTVLLMRYFPARRIHQILTFVGIVFLCGLVLFIRLMAPEKYLGMEVENDLMVLFVEKLKVPEFGFLPSTWAARAILFGAQDNLWTMGKYGLILFIGALIAFSWTAFLAKRVYYRGWSEANTSQTGGKWENEGWFYKIVRTLIRPVPVTQRALFLKDLKLFWRDTSQWSQLFILGALVVVYIYNIRNLPLPTIYLKNLISIVNIGLAGIVMAAVSSRFVFSTTSIEGKYFWTIYSSPLDLKKFLWEKFFLYLLPLLILAEALVVISNLYLEVDGYIMMVSVIAISCITLGLTGMGVGLGAMYPLFRFEHVAEISMSVGGILYMILSLSFVGIIIMIGAWPVHVHFQQKFLFNQIGGNEVYICYFAIFLITLLVILIPMKLAHRTLRVLEL